MTIDPNGPVGAAVPVGAGTSVDPITFLAGHIVSNLTVRQAASCRLIGRSWRDAIDAHGTLAYGAKANAHRVSFLQWRSATSGARQQTWQEVARALQERQRSLGSALAVNLEVQAAYVVNSPAQLRAWMDQRVLPPGPQLDLAAGLDMATKLQRYCACWKIDRSSFWRPDDLVALWARKLCGMSPEIQPEILRGGPALRGAKTLSGITRIDSYGREVGKRPAAGSSGRDGRLALGTEYAAPVMVGWGFDGSFRKPNLTMVLVAENEARTKQRFFRLDVGDDARGALQIDQPEPFAADEGFVHSASDSQTRLPGPLFWATTHIELLHSSWPEGRKAAYRHRAGSSLAQLLMGARLEHLDKVMPEDEHQVRPWFDDLAPPRDREALSCGYRLARADELPLLKLAAAAGFEATGIEP